MELDGELVATGFGVATKTINRRHTCYTYTGTWLNNKRHGKSAY